MAAATSAPLQTQTSNPRRQSFASAGSAVPVRVAFSAVKHIDSKTSLQFMLKLRGGQNAWAEDGLDTLGHANIDRKFEYVNDRPASAPRRRAAKKPKMPRKGLKVATGKGGKKGTSVGSPTPSNGRGTPTSMVAGAVPKSNGPPPSGCKNPGCIKINKWSWQLEAENSRLRSIIENMNHEAARASLSQTMDGRTSAVISSLRDTVSVRNGELKEMRNKYATTAQDRDEMQKTLLQLHQEYAKLKKEHKEMMTEYAGLKTRYNVLAAGQTNDLADRLAKPNPGAYAHNGTYGKVPLAKVLENQDGTPTRLLRQLGSDVKSASATGLNAPEAVWSCCLQHDRTAGCTVPAPSTIGDVARKRRQRTPGGSTHSSSRRRPKSRGRARPRPATVGGARSSRSRLTQSASMRSLGSGSASGRVLHGGAGRGAGMGAGSHAASTSSLSFFAL